MSILKHVYDYNLLDDGGCSTIELPVLLPIGSTFKHEFGTYVVTHHISGDTREFVYCEKIRRPDGSEYGGNFKTYIESVVLPYAHKIINTFQP